MPNDQIRMTNQFPMTKAANLVIGVWSFVGHWGLVIRHLCFLLALLFSLQASADLRTLTTNYYRIQSDVESSLADDLARRMNRMYEEYSRRLVDFSPPEGNRIIA